MIAEYAENNSCIKPVYNEKNLGLVGNYISAISHCSGKYIAMCDGDDLWNDKNNSGNDIASGIYIYIINCEGKTTKGKLAIER